MWHHYAELTHGWLQMTAWIQEAVKGVRDIATETKTLVDKRVSSNSMYQHL